MGALIFAAGWALNFTQNPILSLQFISALGFVLVVGFLGWAIFDLHNENKSLKDAKPSVKVTSELDNGHYYLRVQNIGEHAEFTAKIKVVKGRSFIPSLLPRYFVPWESIPSETTEIDKWDDDRLHIAKLEAVPIVKGDAVEDALMHWDFYYYEITSVDALGSFGSIKNAQSNSLFGLSIDKSMPDITLEVTITSNPSMLDAFTRTYQLTVGGLAEVNSA
jgi:hypothetical protein